MKRLIFFAILAVGLVILAQCTLKEEQAMTVIPKPAYYQELQSSFIINDGMDIGISRQELAGLQEYLIKEIESSEQIKLIPGDFNSSIQLVLNKELPDSLANEGYLLRADRAGIKIESPGKAGLFYGLQTLLQLIGPDGRVPGVSISDVPRFAWRGYMLDVSRHFFSKEYILKVIDYLAMHKMNTLHLHLTDDQGWRIEIKKYPKLTEIGAWRVDRENLNWNARENQKPGEEATYGGFYTQEDIREIVAYAQSRYVTVVPEIEMPGHATAVLAAYPEYSCTNGPFTVLPGGVWPITDIFCAGKDKTFDFIQDVLTEIIDLFPSEYIHIGGDEANKKEWKVCSDCQKRISDEGLADEHELQSYFITRIEKFLNSKGRQLIGWDEILEGGLAPNAAVMSWRGMEGGITAAKSGHPVVMTPTSHCYFDYYQGKPELEPLAIGGFLPLEKVYALNPVPDELTELEALNIQGVQANLWTEYVSTTEHADYMTFPRLSALAEVAWTPQENKDFDDFAERLRSHLSRLEKKNINYSKSFSNVELETEFDLEKREFMIQLSNPINFGEIRYSIDGTEPTVRSTLYKEPFIVNQTTVVKAVTLYADKPYSVVSSEKVWIHEATGAQTKYCTEYSQKYTAGGSGALTNSLRGSVNSGDGRWQGFDGNDLEVIIDLGQEKDITKVSLGCLQSVGSWIFFPEIVAASVSVDGIKFDSLGEVKNKVSHQDPDRKIQDFIISTPGKKARYVRIIAKNIVTCPEWHSGAGEPAWLFVDEIIIE